jgi:hypothetical protein
MLQKLQARLDELKREFATGQTQLQELEQKEASLRETLLRISGAIQVIEELLAQSGEDQKESPVKPEPMIDKPS